MSTPKTDGTPDEKLLEEAIDYVNSSLFRKYWLQSKMLIFIELTCLKTPTFKRVQRDCWRSMLTFEIVINVIFFCLLNADCFTIQLLDTTMLGIRHMRPLLYARLMGRSIPRDHQSVVSYGSIAFPTCELRNKTYATIHGEIYLFHGMVLA